MNPASLKWSASTSSGPATRCKLYADGLVAQEAFSRQIPDLIILDVMLPGMDGFALTRSLRNHSEVPIILVTSRREESDRIAGLELGADDYVVKPFSPQELVSRVRAVLRRISKEEKSHTDAPISFPSLSMDPQTRIVIAQGQEISLTAKEFDMLYHFIRHPHLVFSVINCSKASGACRNISIPAPSPSISAACARRSKPTHPILPIYKPSGASGISLSHNIL